VETLENGKQTTSLKNHQLDLQKKIEKYQIKKRTTLSNPSNPSNPWLPDLNCGVSHMVTKADIRKWPVILTDVLFPSDFSGKKSPSNRKLLQKSSNIVSTTVDVTSIPSGKRLRNYGKSPFFMGKLTISMAIFNSYVKLPEGR
jgi:hypothetical protein